MSWRQLLMAAVILPITALSSREDDREAIETVFTEYFRAIADGNGQEACARQTSRAQAATLDFVVRNFPELGAADPVDAIEKTARLLSPELRAFYRTVTVGDITVEDQSARVVMNGAESTVRFVQAGGRWRVDTGLYD